MRTEWQNGTLILADSSVERNQESTDVDGFLPSAPIKWVSPKAFWRILLSFWGLSIRRSECPVS